MNSEKHVAKIGIFKERIWLNLVEINLMNDNNIAFSFYNARVVLNILTQRIKNIFF